MYEFRDGHLFKWTQPQSDDLAFTISRYNLYLWKEGDEGEKDKIIIADEIEKCKRYDLCLISSNS